jgi:hypothetical protein
MTDSGQGMANGHRRRPAADVTLRTSWLARTDEAGRHEPVRRRTPAVDDVISALIGPDRSLDALENALRALAWERAWDRLGLDAALEDLDALWAVLESGGLAPVSRRQARAWLVDGWVDALAAERGAPCLDPLSGLHTASYLVARIHELDRLVDDEAVPLVLLALRWPEPSSPWARIALILAVARTVRAQVRPDATLGQDGAGTVLALVPDDALARLERAALARSCDQAPLADAGILTDLVPVPERRELVPGVVRRLRLSAPPAERPNRPTRDDRSGS